MKPLQCQVCKIHTALVCKTCLETFANKFKNEISLIKNDIVSQQKKFDEYKRQFKLTNNKEKDSEHDLSYFKSEIEKLRIKVNKYEELIKKNKVSISHGY